MNGLQEKQLGLYRTEANNKALVGLARLIAKDLCAKYGSCTIDDVRADPRLAEFQPTSSAVWGSVFHGDEWRSIGFEKSQIVTNHARIIQRWTLAR